MFIKVENLYKIFEKTAIKQALHIFKMLFCHQYHLEITCEKKVAVDNVSVHVNKGERVGVIGRNGAGKSTLLQIISGLSAPTSGTVETEGAVNCILALGTGLRDNLTGRENIYLDGEVDGKSHEEVDLIIDDIISFADIGEFIDHPVKTYSSGMRARLAFAIITTLNPEILIIDEALSVGDNKFALKATARMNALCEKGKILLLVSHSMPTICNMCNRCIYMENGKLIMDSSPQEVTKKYLENVRNEDRLKFEKAFEKKLDKGVSSEEYAIKSFIFRGADGKENSVFDYNEKFYIELEIKYPEQEKLNICISVEFERVDGLKLFKVSRGMTEISKGMGAEAPSKIRLSFPGLRLGMNFYHVNVVVHVEGNEEQVLASQSKALKIENHQYVHQNPIQWIDATWNIKGIEASE